MSYEPSDSSISSAHNFLSCSLIMDAAVAPTWTAHEVHKDALESFLLARPLTSVKTTKFTTSRDKAEYHHCHCKCSYRINIYLLQYAKGTEDTVQTGTSPKLCMNSFSSIFSTWLDYKMKELLHLFPSYIKTPLIY